MQNVDSVMFQKSLDQELHDLCQPLASLQCRLEIGRMLDNEVALREAVDGGLEDLQRLHTVLQRIRALALTLKEENCIA